MHEGDHDIIKDTDREFEDKFCHDGCEAGADSGHHVHHGHVHEKKKPGKGVEIIAGIAVAVIILIFVYFKFISRT